MRKRKGWRTSRTAGDARRTGGTKRKVWVPKMAARKQTQNSRDRDMEGGQAQGAEWIWGAISSASSGPGEFAHKSLG